MEVKVIVSAWDQLEINLIDVWYKSNYWETTSNQLEVKTGPLTYLQGHRKAMLWDGAGTVILEIANFDFRTHNNHSFIVGGPAFYNVKGKALRYGEHRWRQDPVGERSPQETAILNS